MAWATVRSRSPPQDGHPPRMDVQARGGVGITHLGGRPVAAGASCLHLVVLSEESTMTRRRHRLVPTLIAALATAAVIAPAAQARPAASGVAAGSGKGAVVVVDRTIH